MTSAEPPADTLAQRVRMFVFGQTAATGLVPQPGVIASALEHPVQEIEAALQELAAGKALILAPSSANIWAPNPFCAVPTGFRVVTAQQSYWGTCVWDALGILAALRSDGRVSAPCADCGNMLVLDVQDGTLVPSAGIIHFAVPARQWWDNIVFT